MFSDSQTTLYVVLSIAITLLTIFFSVTLIYLILILRDVSKMLEKARETADRINAFIIKPVSLAASIVDHVRPLIETAIERYEEKREHHGSGRKKSS